MFHVLNDKHLLDKKSSEELCSETRRKNLSMEKLNCLSFHPTNLRILLNLTANFSFSSVAAVFTASDVDERGELISVSLLGRRRQFVNCLQQLIRQMSSNDRNQQKNFCSSTSKESTVCRPRIE